MTEKEFYKQLSKIKRKWIRNSIHIRTVDGECPLVALARTKGVRLLNQHYKEAGTVLGLRKSVAQKIASAADGMFGPTREKLFVACGLKNGPRP